MYNNILYVRCDVFHKIFMSVAAHRVFVTEKTFPPKRLPKTIFRSNNDRDSIARNNRVQYSTKRTESALGFFAISFLA